MQYSNRRSALRSFLIALGLAVLVFTFDVHAQMAETKGASSQGPAPVTSASRDEIERKVMQLEEQLGSLKAELESLKKLMSATGDRKEQEAEAATDAGVSQKAAGTTSQTVAAAPKQQQTQPQKQIGFDVGSVRIVPYGAIYFNAFNNSGSVNNQDVPMFAAAGGQSGASASLRQTRLGLRFDGAKLGTGRLGGVIEADFFGGFPSVGIGENFGIVRLRLANVRMDWEKTSVTVGQDWMPFAPVNPTSIASAAIPQLASAGNNWARLPQVRVDHRLNEHLTITGAVLAPQTGDYPASSFSLQNSSGSSSHVPFLQSRIAYAAKDWWGTKRSGSIGLSGHFGRSSLFVGSSVEQDVDSVGLALDWNFPLHTRVSFAGEAFSGRNLGGFQAGVFQSVNTEFAFRSGSSVTPAGARAIGTRGGWLQVGFTPDLFRDRWSIYGSVGIDDPRNEDLTSISRANFRARNLAYAFNTIYKVTPQFSLGAEFRRFQTTYFITGRRSSEHVNLGAVYSF